MDAIVDVALDIINKLFSFLSTQEGEATIFLVIVLLLKLFVNIKATALDFKKMIVTIPSEVTILVIGFLMSYIVAPTESGGDKAFPLMQVSLAVLIVQLAVEKYVDDKLSGNVGFGRACLIVVMFLVSLGLYSYVLFGGGNNG